MSLLFVKCHHVAAESRFFRSCWTDSDKLAVLAIFAHALIFILMYVSRWLSLTSPFSLLRLVVCSSLDSVTHHCPVSRDHRRRGNVMFWKLQLVEVAINNSVNVFLLLSSHLPLLTKV